jgi:LMBR1 domain-containing protein 1
MAGPDGVVIAVGVIIAVLIVFGIVVFMVYMQHPEDKLVAWFPKLVVFLGLFLTCITVLLVPFDVAIQNGIADQIFSDMTVLWFALFYMVAGWAIIVCPFTIFWYLAVKLL